MGRQGRQPDVQPGQQWEQQLLIQARALMPPFHMDAGLCEAGQGTRASFSTSLRPHLGRGGVGEELVVELGGVGVGLGVGGLHILLPGACLAGDVAALGCQE